MKSCLNGKGWGIFGGGERVFWAWVEFWGSRGLEESWWGGLVYLTGILGGVLTKESVVQFYGNRSPMNHHVGFDWLAQLDVLATDTLIGRMNQRRRCVRTRKIDWTKTACRFLCSGVFAGSTSVPEGRLSLMSQKKGRQNLSISVSSSSTLSDDSEPSKQVTAWELVAAIPNPITAEYVLLQLTSFLHIKILTWLFLGFYQSQNLP